MRREFAAIALVILLAVTLGVGYLAGSSSRASETVTSTFTSVSTSTLTSQRTITSTTILTSTSALTITSERTVTSIVTSTMPGGQPIPFASVETADVPVRGAYAIAVNTNASRLYVLGASSLVVVDTSSHSVLANISLPGKNLGGIVNAGLTIDYSTGMVYASVEGKVVEVNGSTNAVSGQLPFSFGTLAFDSETHTLWGTQLHSNGSLVGVDVRTGSVVANVSVGFAPDGIAVDRHNDMVYAAGCTGSFVCGSEAAVVNGTSGTLVNTVSLPSAYYSTMTLNPTTDVLYVSGERLLAALNGTNGDQLFQVDPQTCGPFLDMGVDPSSNQVLMVPQNYDYLLAYDGTTGALVNMYSFPSSIGAVALNPGTGEIYVTGSGGLLALRPSASTGHVNSTLIGSSQSCLPV